MKLSSECVGYVKSVNKIAKAKKPKKVSGYNVFGADNREEVSKKHTESGKVVASAVMKEIGAMWGKLTPEEKAKYNEKAKEQNEQIVANFKDEEIDEQVQELKDLIAETIKKFKKLISKKVEEGEIEEGEGEKAEGEEVEVEEVEVEVKEKKVKGKKSVE